MVVAMKKLSNIERVALGSIREELQPSRLDQGAHRGGEGGGGRDAEDHHHHHHHHLYLKK